MVSSTACTLQSPGKAFSQTVEAPSQHSDSADPGKSFPQVILKSCQSWDPLLYLQSLSHQDYELNVLPSKFLQYSQTISSSLHSFTYWILLLSTYHFKSCFSNLVNDLTFNFYIPKALLWWIHSRNTVVISSLIVDSN